MFQTSVTEEVIKCTTNLPNKHAAAGFNILSVFIVKK